MAVTDYLELLGEQVIWTDGMGTEYRGRVVAYSDRPTYLMDFDDGRRFMVDASSARKQEEA